MKIPMNLPMWLAALAPIGTLLVLLLGFRWKAVKAGAVSLAVAVWVAVAAYRAELSLLLVQGAKGVWDAMIILLIISTAVLLYQVGEEADAFSAIREGMGKVFPNELLLILSMSWIFESFFTGHYRFWRACGGGSSTAGGNRCAAPVGGSTSAGWTVLGQYFWNAGGVLGRTGHVRGAVSGKRGILSDGFVGSWFYLGLEFSGRTYDLLVLWKKKSGEKRLACCTSVVCHPGRRRGASESTQSDALLLPSGVRFPVGGPFYLEKRGLTGNPGGWRTARSWSGKTKCRKQRKDRRP